MRDSDKFLSDLDAWLRRLSGKSPSPSAFGEAERLLSRYLPGISEALRADLFQGFRDRVGREGASAAEAAITWLGAIAGLLSGEGAGEGLSAADWAELGETVSANAEEMDMDRLTEIMSLVLDHGGL